tara:strand:+ start:13711 stop:13953 length:243 start_codon:yes stop_codon:yes gene_type:complete
MPLDREYARLLHLAVEEQLKADATKAVGLHAVSEVHVQLAESYRDQAKALADRPKPKPVYTIDNLPGGQVIKPLLTNIPK